MSKAFQVLEEGERVPSGYKEIYEEINYHIVFGSKPLEGNASMWQEAA